MIKNNKGFSLVELLVAIVILGIITGMSWPVIRRLQEDNTYRKYTNYGEILINAAKLYVDAYEEDLFLYDDDIDKMSAEQLAEYRNKGQLMDGNKQCVFITFQDFRERSLIKDINMENVSCYSDYTFVRVIRDDKKYSYKYYLGCGRRASSKVLDKPLLKASIDFTLPDRDNILELNAHYAERCND
jgi:prepilin-type N-terminal cleavage/methylation domain-containing protein